jgi:non-ribosomal peptide synthetase component F
VLTPAEEHRILRTWNRTAAPVPGLTLPELFSVQAARTPDRVALWDGAETLTFAELDRRSARLARLLVAHGAGPERIVAIARTCRWTPATRRRTSR